MSCLFDSLSFAVGINPLNLRLIICNYLENNPALVDDLKLSAILKATESLSLTEYTRKMSNESTWGSALELKSFCDIFSMSVQVHVTYTGQEFTIVCSNPKPRKLVHIYYNGSHYEPGWADLL